MEFLAREGPLARNPSSYIRFIYNRVNLEKAVIRAAAVSSLASFAHKVPSLKKSIVLLLEKCLNDSDDEVRERAFFYLSVVGESKNLSEDISSHVSTDERAEAEFADACDFIFDQDQMIDVDALEQFITEKKDELIADNGEDFNIDLTPMLIAGKGAKKPASQSV